MLLMAPDTLEAAWDELHANEQLGVLAVSYGVHAAIAAHNDPLAP